MQYIIYLLFLFLSPLSLGSSPLQGEELKKQLSPYQKLEEIKAEFDQTRRIERWNTDIKTTGQLHYQKTPQSTILWEIKKPEYSALRFTPEGLFVKSDTSQKEWKTIKNPQLQKQIEPLFSWLSFDEEKIAKIYSVYLLEKNLFQLVPKNSQSPLKSIEIKGNGKEIKEVTLVEKTNDRIFIQFKTINTKP